MRSFDNISKDIGAELKAAAERIYRIGNLIQLIILIVGVLGGVITLFDTEEFIFFLAIAGGALVEFLIARGIIYMISVRLYAEGEKVHLLKRNGDAAAKETSPAVVKTTATPASTPAPKTYPASFGQANMSQPAPAGSWRCSCGRVNASYVSSCTCGKNKRDQ